MDFLRASVLPPPLPTSSSSCVDTSHFVSQGMFARASLASIERLADNLAAKNRRTLLRLSEARTTLASLTSRAQELSPECDIASIIKEFQPTMMNSDDEGDQQLSVGAQYAQAYLFVKAKKSKLDAALQEANAGNPDHGNIIADLRSAWLTSVAALNKLMNAAGTAPRSLHQSEPTAEELAECQTFALRRVVRLIRGVEVSDIRFLTLRHHSAKLLT